MNHASESNEPMGAKRHWAVSLAFGLLSVVRLMLFFVLFWLRFIVVPLCNLLSGVLLLALLFALYAFPDKTQMLWSFGIVSFVAFVVGYAYDYVLALLSPEEMMVLR